MKRRDIDISGICLCIVLVAVAATGCVKRPLERRPVPEEMGRLEVSIVWPENVSPGSARLNIYLEEGQGVEMHEGLEGDYYEGDLAADSYRLVVHNEDMESVGIKRADEYHNLYLHALDLDGDEPSEGDLLCEPHSVYGIGLHSEGETFVVTAGDTTRLRVEPRSMTKRVYMLIHISGLESVSSMEGTVNGVSPSLQLNSGVSSDLSCRQGFEAAPYSETKSGNTHKMTSSMELFDLLTGPDSPAMTNTLEAAITDGNGKRYDVNADLTGALKELASGNGGELPSVIPLELSFTIEDILTGDFVCTVMTTDWVPGMPLEGELEEMN